ncbi:hypothetical protein LCGC14_2843650 [marine sediment metagenome]|uniref:Uncharacterized protein n=1 Tax=marine sediment metagenome TaxID=412755 RepID=A0A0F8YAM2_9ZZZZ
MNLEEIKKKYPKAWEKFENFAIVDPELEADSFGYSDDYVDDINRLSLTTLSGYLYRFFDEQGIRPHVLTLPNGTFRPYLFKQSGKVWLVLELEEYEYGFQTRQQAEQATFTKAFEILEQKK